MSRCLDVSLHHVQLFSDGVVAVEPDAHKFRVLDFSGSVSLYRSSYKGVTRRDSFQVCLVKNAVYTSLRCAPVFADAFFSARENSTYSSDGEGAFENVLRIFGLGYHH